MQDKHCFTLDGLPDQLTEDQLDEYLFDENGQWREFYGPSFNSPTKKEKGARNRWIARSPTAARLIQLAFHDCLR